MIPEQSSLNRSAVARSLAQSLHRPVEVLDESWSQQTLLLARPHGAVLVGSTLDRPMVQSEETLQVIRSTGTPFLGAVIVGANQSDDGELAELTEMEWRELLAAFGYGDAPVLYIDSLDEPYEEQLLAEGIVVSETDLGSRLTDLLEVLGFARDGTKAQALRNAAALRYGEASGRALDREVEDMVVAARGAWAASLVEDWFVSPNTHLGGATPIDAVARHGSEPVLRAIEAEMYGEYV